MEIRYGKLTVTGDLNKLPEGALDRLIAAFDTAYPVIWKRFGEGEEAPILYVIEGNYDGIAYTAGHKIGLNPAWLISHPQDIDCMTHELVHAAQHYPTYRHSWLVEGIADYGRDLYGVNNAAAGWKLPAKYRGGRMTDGYSRTAAFLKFIEQNYCADIVDTLHLSLRNETFTPKLFETCTGMTAEELWDAYTKG